MDPMDELRFIQEVYLVEWDLKPCVYTDGILKTKLMENFPNLKCIEFEEKFSDPERSPTGLLIFKESYRDCVISWLNDRTIPKLGKLLGYYQPLIIGQGIDPSSRCLIFYFDDPEYPIHAQRLTLSIANPGEIIEWYMKCKSKYAEIGLDLKMYFN